MADAPRILESPDDVLSTLKADGRRRWIYPVTSHGRFLTRRRIVGWVLVVLFIALPLIRIQGKPALLLDVVAREFTIFGLTLYATDTLLLMVFMLTVFMSVFLFTALFGRVWCGWACPQTVYLEFVFRPIESFFEGKPNVRRRRDEGPATLERVLRKGAKWAVFAVIAVGLAHTFVAYFVGWDRLVTWIGGKPSEHIGFFAVMAVTSALILFDFGFFREQMCTITCPYARFQSVLQDRDSLIVSYDPARGEPRGRRSREQREQEKGGVKLDLGDCIDCAACVRTCPTGIDIRDGLQMECIGCTQCVDACDSIMEGIGKPRGLVRYTSENQIEGKPTHVARVRTVGYGVVLAGLLVTLGVLLVGRTPIDVNIGRAGSAPFAMLPDGSVSNRIRFRVQNRTHEPATYTVKAVQPDGLQIKLVGKPTLDVDAGKTERVEAWIVAPPTAFQNGKTDAKFRVSDESGHTQDVGFTLLGPST